ncbi:MAG TPA: enoyl-CoA hydratase-related protein [Burkholderiaceae bacterium]|jgi:enoyl-CoA hydratase/carnithine racemase
MRYGGPDGALAALHCIDAELDDGVLTIALNRPDARNRLNVALTLEMAGLLPLVAGDDAVRVVVIRGRGPDFCAGTDTQDFDDAARHGEHALRAARAAADDWRGRGLRQLPQPVIALVHGHCLGGGIGILEGCDIVFAADDGEFGLSEIGNDGDSDGRLAAGPVGKSISRVMQPRAASFHALTGARFDGRQAERNGLVTRSFPAAELERETETLARELAAKDPLALRFTKETLAHVGAMSWDGALNFTAAKLAEIKSLQAGRPSSRAAAVQSFLSGASKPGLGA